MSTWGVCIVRDEADIIETTLRHVAAQGVAGIIVVDRMSSDGTEAILDSIDLPCELVVEQWYEDAWWQGRRMTEACDAALERGADWIIPFDADELFSHPAGPLADVLAETPGPSWPVVMYHHFRTLVDPPGASPFHEMVWRADEWSRLGKHCVKWRKGMVMAEGNHYTTGAMARPPAFFQPVEARHFPYRSEAQFIRKIVSGWAALRLTTLPEHIGAHWRAMGRAYDEGGEAALRAWYRDGFLFADPRGAGLVHDPAKVAS